MPCCPYCKKIVDANAKFCTGCGKPFVANLPKCLKCGSPLNPGVKFCVRCGEPAPVPCPNCGSPLNKLAKFCVSCGNAIPVSLWQNSNVCTNCGATLKPGSKFCTSCGTAVAQPSVQASEATSQNNPSAPAVTDSAAAEKAAAEQARLEEQRRQEEAARAQAEAERLAAEKAAAEKAAAEQARLEEQRRQEEAARVQAEAERLAAESNKVETPASPELPQAAPTTIQAAVPPVAPVPQKKGPPVALIAIPVVLVIAAIVVVVTFIFGHKTTELDTYFQEKFEYQKVVDARDKQEYRSIKIGSQVWLAQNMNYATKNSVCDSCELYGRYYSFEEAQNVCPDGFNLPTISDFMELQAYDASALKSIKGWNAESAGSDEVGFVSIPAGFFSYKDAVVKRRSETSGFWSSIGNSENAVRLKVEKNGMPGALNALDARYGFPVRCISSATSKTTGEDDVVLDGRNGVIYKKVNVGNQVWLAKNSNNRVGKSFCYDDDPSNCETDGRLYDWASALEVCPSGTRLPNAADIADLKKILKNNPSAGSVFTNVYPGFRSAKISSKDVEKYDLKGNRADFWMASEIYSNAKYWFFSTNSNDLGDSKLSKKAAMSVRCIVGDLTNEVKFGSIVDDRDDRSYKIVNIGKQTWMAENLKYNLEGSFCYNDEYANCENYGRLYVYADAKEMCPEDFHLPDDSEWQTLKNYISDHGNGKMATVLKGFSEWTNAGLDFWGMDILPTGSRSEYGDYSYMGERAILWSDSYKDEDSASVWQILDNAEGFSKASVYRREAHAVRCIRDEFMKIQNPTIEQRSMKPAVEVADENESSPDYSSVATQAAQTVEKAQSLGSRLDQTLQNASDEYRNVRKQYDEAVKAVPALTNSAKKALRDVDRAVDNANSAIRDANRMLNSMGF